MSWLLLVLKILGILLLTVLSLVLLVVILILFVPIRYRGHVCCREAKSVKVKLNASWLWFVLRGQLSYPDNQSVFCVRLFGILIRGNQKKNKRNRKKKTRADDVKTGKTNHTAETMEGPEQDEAAGSMETSQKEETTGIMETFQKEETAGTVETSQKEETAGTVEMPQKEKPARDKSVSAKKTETGGKKKNTLGKRIAYVRELLQQERNKRMLAFAFDKLKRMLRHILPRKLKGTLIFGTGDPCSTGQALGAIAVLFARCGELFRVTPDFEERKFECDLRMKGRIQIATLLILYLKIKANQKLMQWIEDIKRIKTIP